MFNRKLKNNKIATRHLSFPVKHKGREMKLNYSVFQAGVTVSDYPRG